MPNKIKFKIDHLDPMGQGVYKCEEKIFFICKTLPGETGTAIITDTKKNIHFAYPESLETTSINRILPPCKHYDQCSSCHYMHTSYEMEIHYKKLSLQKHLQKFHCEENTFFTHPALNRFGYRNRTQLHYDLIQMKLGIISRFLNKIIPIPECLLLNNQITTELKSLYKRGLQSVIDSSKHPPKGHIEISFNKSLKTFINMPYAYEGFSQVNEDQNNLLCNLLEKTFHKFLKKEPTILDLFGGNGNLSKNLPAENIHVIDLYKNPPTKTYNQTFTHLDLYKKEATGQLIQICKAADLVILDPPRSGFKELYLIIEKYRPDFIFYVSCNPATLSRDLSTVNGYKILENHLIDFFPNTYHFESFCVLERIK